MTSKKPEPLTSVLHNGGFSSSYDNLVQGSSAVLRLNFCAINPPLRKAENRYMQCCQRGYKNQSIAKQN